MSYNTTHVVLIRHGESEWNGSNLFCGWYDAQLSSKGMEDAKSLSAKSLIEHDIKFDCVYTSALMRAHQTVNIILEALKLTQLPVTKSWRLNERHYGALTGYNKRQMADKYGIEQVQIWRRSFDICPPPLTEENPYYHIIRNNPSFSLVPEEQFPDTESLKTVMERVVPFWKEHVEKDIKNGRQVLVVAHGTVLRALMKYLQNVSEKDICKINVPNSIPCVYEFDVATGNLVGNVEYLAEENILNKLMEKTASIGN